MLGLHYQYAMQLEPGGINNNHIIANCLQSAPVNKFWKKLVNYRRRYWQK